jgi:flagellar hook-associated protein 1 FlgK
MAQPPGGNPDGFTEIRMTNGPSLWISTSDVDVGILHNFDLHKVNGGELKAFIDMRDGTGIDGDQKGIPYYIEMLNNLTRALVQEVNKIHREGFNDHPVDGSRNGINFFFEPPGGLLEVTAKNFRLSDEVMASASNIAASSAQIERGFTPEGTPTFLQRGNNENMNRLYELFSLERSITVQGSNGETVVINSFNSYATSIVHDVASTTYLALNAARNGNTLITAMGNQRLAVAGVSLDEEMVSLIRFQHAYSGAARVINAMDDALDRLINGTGRVGL